MTEIVMIAAGGGLMFRGLQDEGASTPEEPPISRATQQELREEIAALRREMNRRDQSNGS